jgi:hypothetical protein
MKNSIFIKNFFYVILFCVCLVINGCSGVDTSSPEALAKSILGEQQNPQDDNDCLVTFEYDSKNKSAIIGYHYTPFFQKELYNEEAAEIAIGNKLSDSVRQLFSSADYFNSITFNIYVPFSDIYGKTTWQMFKTFTITRDTYNKINWDNFNSSNLMNLSE